MDAAAGGGILTACLAVGGLLIRLAIRTDMAERRRHPHRTQPPTVAPLPRDPAVRTGAEIRELSTREPSSNTEPRDRMPQRPTPLPPEPVRRRPEPRTEDELRDLLG